MTKTVWTFTNKKSLNKKQFIDYFERKVLRTIRKYSMLPENKIIKLKKSNDFNTLVLKRVLEKNFKVEFSDKPNFSSKNLSQISEDIFKNVLNGKFNCTFPDDKIKMPLYFISDKEVELYAKLNNIKGRKREQNMKIQSLFERFLKKNQDLELNIVRAFGQIK